MKQLSLIALLFIAPLAVMAQTAVFTDTFGSSTTNHTSTPGGTPAVSSTSYDIASTKAATTGPSIASGNFRISLNGTTTGGFVEAQALFTGTPVALVTVGDYINLTYTFTNTGGTLLAGGTNSYVFTGLYNSGGSAPVAGSLNNSGLTSTPGSAFATGNCANWQGYVSRIANGSASQAYTRPAQTNAPGGPSANQDLIGNGFGGGTYTNLTGVVFDANETATVALTSGSQYTISYSIALTAAGTLTVTNNLYSGVGTGGTLVFSQTNTASGANVLVTSFDGLSIGLRNSGTSFNPTMDISKISISASIAGSPGPSFNVTGGGAGCPGDPFPVGLSGSVTTNVYRLYTNGVFDGAVAVQTGTGSAISFGLQSVVGTYTVVASNTVTANTGLMSGSAVISLLAGPVITTQPSTLVVATNSSGIFSVTASGSGLNYRWYRNGSGLTDGGHVSGAATSTLLISPATTADAATTAQGYYVVITNSCGLSAISITNSLTLDAPANLVWQGGNPNTNWDLSTTANFTNSAGASVVFHGGDNVTFNDSSINPVVTLVGSYLAPTLITESASQNYAFTGNGAISGAAALLMTGAGTLTISNANTYSGGTTISNGTVVIRNANMTSLGIGPVTMAGGTLDIPLTGSSIVGLSNNVNVTANSTLQYDLLNTYSCVLFGTLTGSPGATLTIRCSNASTGVGRTRLYGAFTNNAPIITSSAGATMEIAPYNASGSQVYNGVISGSARFVPRGNGDAIFNAANSFSDGTYGVLLSGGNVGIGADSVPTSGAVISSPVGTGSLGIDVTPSGSGNSSLFASGGAHTIANPIAYTSTTNTVTLSITGSNNLTLSGTFALSGADGTGNTNRTIQVNNTGLTTLSGVIGDSSLVCGIIKTGTGVLALNNAANTYTGPTIVSNGMLEGNGTIASPVTIETSGTLGAGTTAIGTLTVNNNVTLKGNALFKINKSASPSNDVVVVSGILTNAGTGTLTVTNFGSALIVGDRFVVFSKPLSNGVAMTVSGGGVTWTNKLAIDGSIVALSVATTVATNPTNMTALVNNGKLELSWPANHTGWHLQVQTNSLSVGLVTNLASWVTIPNTDLNNSYTNTINPANGTVFYRMVYP